MIIVRPTDRPLLYGESAEVVVWISSLISHCYAVYDALKRWRRAATEDVERGRTFCG